MSNKILEIKSGKSSQPNVSVNLLPCRVNHDGSVDPSQGYWKPTEAEGKKTAYFRGRKLQGRSVQIPDGYKGVIVENRETEQAEARQTTAPQVIDVDDEEEERLCIGRLEPTAEFNEMTVWGHEATADAGSDPYTRGIEEWVSLANQIHSDCDALPRK